mmetsp:Transcript_46354/g.148882  ORF Transcript_46354/g.148882 Transcript_46354/m.148882 type:complete len:283 (+) Transcript_46354:1492-2340(+)
MAPELQEERHECRLVLRIQRPRQRKRRLYHTGDDAWPHHEERTTNKRDHHPLQRNVRSRDVYALHHVRVQREGEEIEHEKEEPDNPIRRRVREEVRPSRPDTTVWNAFGLGEEPRARGLGADLRRGIAPAEEPRAARLADVAELLREREPSPCSRAVRRRHVGHILRRRHIGRARGRRRWIAEKVHVVENVHHAPLEAIAGLLGSSSTSTQSFTGSRASGGVLDGDVATRTRRGPSFGERVGCAHQLPNLAGRSCRRRRRGRGVRDRLARSRGLRTRREPDA